MGAGFYTEGGEPWDFPPQPEFPPPEILKFSMVFGQDCVRSNLRRSKNQKFHLGTCPQIPLGCSHADTCVAVLTHASTTFTNTSPPPPSKKSCMKPWRSGAYLNILCDVINHVVYSTNMKLKMYVYVHIIRATW